MYNNTTSWCTIIQRPILAIPPFPLPSPLAGIPSSPKQILFSLFKFKILSRSLFNHTRHSKAGRQAGALHTYDNFSLPSSSLPSQCYYTIPPPRLPNLIRRRKALQESGCIVFHAAEGILLCISPQLLWEKSALVCKNTSMWWVGVYVTAH